MRALSLTALLCAWCAGPALAAGLLIPKDTSIPPLALRGHRVAVEILPNAATTTVELVFENHTDRALEARFVFPLPKGALVQKFVVRMGGRDLESEIVPKDRARELYQSMVRRSGNPGLLEYVGADLIAATIYPVPPQGTQQVTVTYQQILSQDNGLYGYTYPMRASAKRAHVHGEFSLEVAIKLERPIKAVYSPSHSVVVTRKSDLEVEVRHAARDVKLDRDFQLFHSTGDKAVSMDLVTWRPDAKEPGYFMLVVTPKSKLQRAELVQRDFVFVMDTSHSMEADGKIDQAKAAMRHCISQLDEQDRFAVVAFSTEVEPWKSELLDATEANRALALRYVDALEATGGTNIDGALEKALSFAPAGSNRPFNVIFMTDGKPTLGATTAAAKILDRLAKPATPIRLFSWGVGYDVDTHLLDQMAFKGGGVSEYVKPEEDIASKIGSFFGKASHPALSSLELTALGDKVQLVNTYPRKLPDLFAGTQMVVLGRYVGEGAVALQLTGQVNAASERFVYEGDFPGQATKHRYIESLWASRRIGYLLDSVRLAGETKEQVDEIVALSRKHGIPTPYTSFVVAEDNQAIALHRGAGGGAPAGRRSDEQERRERAVQQLAADAAKAAGDRPGASPAPPADKEIAAANDFARDLAEGFEKKDGKAGVAVATYLNKLKDADVGSEGKLSPFKLAGTVRYFACRELLVDERYDAACAVCRVKFGSDAYFELLERHPELEEAFKLGPDLLIVTKPGQALLISGAGVEAMSAAEIAKLF